MSKNTNITSCFPIATLTPVVAEDAHGPSYTTLDVMQTEINSNAMSVPTRVANGDLGYLALVISEAKFFVHSGGITYIAPTSPPEAPVHPAGATSSQITEINHQYLQDQKTFDTYSEVS